MKGSKSDFNGTSDDDDFIDTDDESSSSMAQQKSKQCTKNEKYNSKDVAELEQAKQLAFQRMEENEEHEEARVFSLLDNLSDNISYSQHIAISRKKSSCQPQENQFIDFEAKEVGDDDSDILADGDENDESFIDDNCFDDVQKQPSQPSSLGQHRQLLDKVEVGAKMESYSGHCGSDSDSDDEGILYEDFSASREKTLQKLVKSVYKRPAHFLDESSRVEEEEAEAETAGYRSKPIKQRRIFLHESDSEESDDSDCGHIFSSSVNRHRKPKKTRDRQALWDESDDDSLQEDRSYKHIDDTDAGKVPSLFSFPCCF